MRELLPLPVPAGAGVLDLLDPLRRALAGEGPAWLPVPVDEPGRAARLTEALAGPLDDGEDDAGDPTALVIATSGSTGEPRGVLLASGALRASGTATHARLGGPGRWLLALPATHIAGMQVLLRSLLAGTVPAVLSGAFRPDAFAAAAAPVLAGDGPRYTALVPTQLVRLVADGGAGLAALRAFDGVLLGGAATPPALLGRARDAGVRVVTTYGMSETAGGCVYDGTPLDGVRVSVTGGDPGRIELAGPVLARGYRRRPADTAAAFVSGRFRTGDLGRLHPDGRLEVLGRVDDLINTGGAKVAPAEVERVLAAQAGVLEACVVGVPDREWGEVVVAALVPADPATPPGEDALRAAVRDRLGRAAAPKSLRFVAELPLRGPGKIDRRAVRSLFDSSSVDA
ncbi:o-succinylbenzoate--CoA ligase [Gandjariella thermophila]|uniref:O-succinylbenzoic acid--CoA ligase n=1 Tax=Gandjariella thermophila TaxID=1931992 RepID=A0A4D4J632_9PSEU|nr:o-succinylbenzoate--CoA ligase [Gandjariella thermophila]GDY29437.1 O-succinylbenzoic acid--CoA ligase [Gandjariella thermophila]